MKKSINKNEIMRKLLHLTSIWVVLLYEIAGIAPTFLIVSGASAVVLFVDIIRITHTRLRPIVDNMLKYFRFQSMFRVHEKNSLSGASYMMISAFMTMLILPKAAFLSAFTILVISDVVASIVGHLYGKHVVANKSLEGTAAFLVSALIICLIIGSLYKVKLLPLFIAAAAATVAELFSKKLKVNDNLLIPIAFGVVWGVLSKVLCLF
jgi:dolichol kinase